MERGFLRMGRPKFFRQRVLTQAASLEAKGLFNYLVSEIRARREVSLDEAILVARDVERFLDQNLLTREPGQIEFPAIAGKDSHRKRPREEQPERLIKLNMVAEEDIGLMAEFGIVALQRGRLARIIEETWLQEAILDGPRLAVLFLETNRGLRQDLQHFWQQDVLLPVSGMRRENRELMKNFRAVLALERYLDGEDLARIRESLAVSTARWQRWWRDFKALLREEPVQQPPEVIAAWQELGSKHRNKIRIDLEEIPARSAADPKSFYELLRHRHGYSPAAAEAFLDELYDLAARLNRQERDGGQVVYNAVAAYESAGKRLAECTLVPVVLDYVTPEDWTLANRDNTQTLKWARLARLAVQAKNQGAVLTQPDLALLLGLSTKAIQTLCRRHPNVILPTRGLMADMGPALSHADKIIRLHMDGYTETEIVRRTGHTYDSVERYLLDFAKVVYLAEQGLPLPAIRKVLGFSRRLVEKYLAMHREFAGPDYQFMMAKIRRLALAHPVKKTRGRNDALAN
jgi:hypothetical protein